MSKINMHHKQSVEASTDVTYSKLDTKTDGLILQSTYEINTHREQSVEVQQKLLQIRN